MNLEKEIKEASERIDSRKTEIESNIESLGTKIEAYTKWAWGFVLIGAGITIFGIIIYVCKNTESGYGLNLLGDFMAGTVASIWSLAGLFFIYVAFLGQKQQLLNQQLEIMYSQLEVKYTRLELAGQKAEMAKQNETLEKQKFENTFFQLLANHNAIVNTIDLWSYRNMARELSAQGRDCFVIFYTRLQSKISKPREKHSMDKIFEIYVQFFQDNVSDLGHYFRNLYHIIKFIEESQIEDKKRYTNFVRAQLSTGELALLFYNCLSKFGNEKFKPLIEKYSLLKNMDHGLLFNQEHLELYNENAFK